ncbi:MAG: hypothetical protein P4M12_04905 [Gammaproteobacteria bacterium]|nr:hypothetical protein [Gammaproteobacteria bacterium]
MKLLFKEPTAPRHIYINKKTNRVHLFMPIMSGTEIGLDNTCKSVYSLQEFFGLLGANQQSTGVGSLEAYQSALAFDLKYMPDSEEKTAKAERLLQIKTYLGILKEVQQDRRITEPLMKVFPLYPESLVHLMQATSANLHSIILRPREQDNQLRTTAILPTFSANHDQMVDGHEIPANSLLSDTLRRHYQGVSFTPKSKEGLIARFLANHQGLRVDFDEIRQALIAEINDYLGVSVDFLQTQDTRSRRAQDSVPSVPMTKDYMNEQLAIDEDNPATTKDYIRGLIEYCTPNLFDDVEGSPFYSMQDAERLTILTQFFLAELNIVCREQGITEANFGKTLESDRKLVEDLANVVKDALVHSGPVEESLIEYIHHYQDRFALKNPIPEDAIPTLKERFKSHWEQIKASPHFDEFMLISDKKGLFVKHQGCIATHFANFLLMGWKYNLDAFREDFDTVDTPDNTVPHKNEHIHATDMEIDLSQMDDNALQALYEDINTYDNPELKAALLAQFKQERPDFKAKVDAKQFLQHVAYGEQNEAEALLQKDPELAQALLQADNIPFTDYSGRTFTCTAYEYAYWAKDTHMQRMLEKYILINEETRQLIFQRVQEIEKRVPSAGPSGFLGRLFGASTEPQGLHYTTQDKQGRITEHHDTGFDLRPLICALRHYVDEYNRRPNKTEADWEVLDKIWIEEVGRSQRDIPAHIAHEYCHPDRSLDDVNNNKTLLDAANPDNLKRQLRFYNYETGNYDVWFSPASFTLDSGLGFSFGIVPAPTGAGGARAWVAGAGRATIDAAALTAIDEVRSNERKQSLINLGQLLTLPASRTHVP